jgi:hypothetical protein
MSRHVLTPAEQLRGIRAAIASPRTPLHLRSALRDHMEVLQNRINRQQRWKPAIQKRSKRKWSLLDWLAL